jgi:polyhydroxyalkanoate synthesis regulator phasin
VRGVTSLLRGSEEKSPVKEVLAAGQTAVEELRAKVDQSVKQALDYGGGAVAQELEKLQRKIESLEKKLEQLGK